MLTLTLSRAFPLRIGLRHVHGIDIRLSNGLSSFHRPFLQLERSWSLEADQLRVEVTFTSRVTIVTFRLEGSFLLWLRSCFLLRPFLRAGKNRSVLHLDV